MEEINPKEKAKKLLKKLRSGTNFDYEATLKSLRKELRKGNLTPQDIGTSEEELKKLGVENWKARVTKWLKYLSFGVYNR